MTKKRILAFLLTAAICLSFAGCGSDAPETSNIPQQTPSDYTDTSSTPDASNGSSRADLVLMWTELDGSFTAIHSLPFNRDAIAYEANGEILLRKDERHQLYEVENITLPEGARFEKNDMGYDRLVDASGENLLVFNNADNTFKSVPAKNTIAAISTNFLSARFESDIARFHNDSGKIEMELKTSHTHYNFPCYFVIDSDFEESSFGNSSYSPSAIEIDGIDDVFVTALGHIYVLSKDHKVYSLGSIDSFMHNRRGGKDHLVTKRGSLVAENVASLVHWDGSDVFYKTTDGKLFCDSYEIALPEGKTTDNVKEFLGGSTSYVIFDDNTAYMLSYDQLTGYDALTKVLQNDSVADLAVASGFVYVVFTDGTLFMVPKL